ncbi:GL22997 [Drosophila persimilis]|uniref:GL22997 n=1 Tax=Drosophila persimilis TaxID=7234 RepID=B4G4J1_DROPE|nr:GL22997 [Drosophila persimilis]
MREAHSHELDGGMINLISNLQIYDEPHDKWDRRGAIKWKVEAAIAAFYLDGSNFQVLHLKLALGSQNVMGSDAINESVSMVLVSIWQHGYGPRLMAIISDGCPNLLANVNAALEYPVLWDVLHLRKLLPEQYGVVDQRLDQLYGLHFTGDDWRHAIYPSVHDEQEEIRDWLAREVEQVQKLVERVCTYPVTYFTTLSCFNSLNLELCGAP